MPADSLGGSEALGAHGLTMEDALFKIIPHVGTGAGTLGMVVAFLWMAAKRHEKQLADLHSRIDKEHDEVHKRFSKSREREENMNTGIKLLDQRIETQSEKHETHEGTCAQMYERVFDKLDTLEGKIDKVQETVGMVVSRVTVLEKTP